MTGRSNRPVIVCLLLVVQIVALENFINSRSVPQKKAARNRGKLCCAAVVQHAHTACGVWQFGAQPDITKRFNVAGKVLYGSPLTAENKGDSGKTAQPGKVDDFLQCLRGQRFTFLIADIQQC